MVLSYAAKSPRSAKRTEGFGVDYIGNPDPHSTTPGGFIGDGSFRSPT